MKQPRSKSEFVTLGPKPWPGTGIASSSDETAQSKLLVSHSVATYR